MAVKSADVPRPGRGAYSGYVAPESGRSHSGGSGSSPRHATRVVTILKSAAETASPSKASEMEAKAAKIQESIALTRPERRELERAGPVEYTATEFFRPGIRTEPIEGRPGYVKVTPVSPPTYPVEEFVRAEPRIQIPVDYAKRFQETVKKKIKYPEYDVRQVPGKGFFFYPKEKEARMPGRVELFFWRVRAAKVPFVSEIAKFPTLKMEAEIVRAARREAEMTEVIFPKYKKPTPSMITIPTKREVGIITRAREAIGRPPTPKEAFIAREYPTEWGVAEAKGIPMVAGLVAWKGIKEAPKWFVPGVTVKAARVGLMRYPTGLKAFEIGERVAGVGFGVGLGVQAVRRPKEFVAGIPSLVGAGVGYARGRAALGRLEVWRKAQLQFEAYPKEFKFRMEALKKLKAKPPVKQIDIGGIERLQVQKGKPAKVLDKWLIKKKRKIIVGGSVAQRTQTYVEYPVKPSDVDIYMKNPSNLKSYATQLKKAGVTGVTFKVTGEGTINEAASVKIGGKKVVEAHTKEWFKQNIATITTPYAVWERGIRKTPRGIRVMEIKAQAKRKLVGAFEQPRRAYKDIPHYKRIVASLKKTEELQKRFEFKPFIGKKGVMMITPFVTIPERFPKPKIYKPPKPRVPRGVEYPRRRVLGVGVYPLYKPVISKPYLTYPVYKTPTVYPTYPAYSLRPVPKIPRPVKYPTVPRPTPYPIVPRVPRERVVRYPERVTPPYRPVPPEVPGVIPREEKEPTPPPPIRMFKGLEEFKPEKPPVFKPVPRPGLKYGYQPQFAAMVLDITAVEAPSPAFGKVYGPMQLRPIIIRKKMKKLRKKIRKKFKRKRR